MFEEKMKTMSFETLGLNEALTKAVTASGYESATEVQTQAIPPALAGADLMVSASTGSGKTAAFILPALQRVLASRAETFKRERGVIYGPRILVLCPTRELAMQVAKAATIYGRFVPGLRVATVVGGVPYPAQIAALRGQLDILISTPGRLLDHLQTGKAVLENVEVLVLDEADRMLDMGFIDDINTIADAIPAARQTVMFSATFAGHVGRLAQNLLRDPKRIDVSSHTDTHENIEQRLLWADNVNHKNALLDHILTQKDMEQALVFTSTQRDADWLADRLADMGHHVASLHGGHPQGRRNRVLQGLRNQQLKILIATDVAARGIDVPTISHVINHGLPMKAEDYVHRIGRTGRAGRNGLAITLAERRDVGMIRRIERFTTQPIAVAVVAGLEPKYTAPTMSGPSFGGKPSFGGRGKPSFGGPRGDSRPAGGGFGGGFSGDRRPAGGGNGGGNSGGFRQDGPRQDGPHQGGFRDAGRPQGGFRDAAAPQGGFRDAGNRDAAPQGGFREGGFRNDSRTAAPRSEGFGGGDRADRPARAGFGGGKPFGGPRRTK